MYQDTGHAVFLMPFILSRAYQSTNFPFRDRFRIQPKNMSADKLAGWTKSSEDKTKNDNVESEAMLYITDPQTFSGQGPFNQMITHPITLLSSPDIKSKSILHNPDLFYWPSHDPFWTLNVRTFVIYWLIILLFLLWLLISLLNILNVYKLPSFLIESMTYWIIKFLKLHIKRQILYNLYLEILQWIEDFQCSV